jgi:uncharacterized membrane protein
MAAQRGSTSNDSALRTARWIGVTIGIGIMGAVDEIIFHQLLQWHNFYVHTTDYWRIFSDGVFHVFTAAMLFFGSIRLWMARRQISPVATNRPFWAGILLGAGGFQLFDGTVNHKLLQLHPVRENVQNLLPYDIAWIASALLLLALGWLLWRRPDEAGR